MSRSGDTWAIVLAGGDGVRLQELTTNLGGVPVPKQYCSVWDGASLLEGALQRATAVASLQRTCAVVAAAHRRWWSTSLGFLPNDNVIVQPKNRGTGVGILLALLHIKMRDPAAIVVVLPSDHHLRDEATMAGSLRDIAERAATDAASVYLLGAEPQQPDPELGYIVTSDRGHAPVRACKVDAFIEKPGLARAAELLASGALVNVFILAGSIDLLLGLYALHHSATLRALSAVLTRGVHFPIHLSLFDAYEHLPTIDFSDDILQWHAPVLRVMAVPACGWTDLGTPERVAEVLKQPPARSTAGAGHSGKGVHLSLSTQWLAHA